MNESQPTANRFDGSPESEATGQYDPTGKTTELFQILDRYLADLQTGKAPDQASLLARHPQLANELKECLAGIDFVHKAAKPNQGTPTQLGDFRIVGEVGRGGMGVVYEAEQVSLKRKVALKVLRFGISTDEEVMKRFQREAETVAHLHHTNIVPIHAIGCDQGVHYYAMQFIEGKSLAAVLTEQASRERNPDFTTIAGWALQGAEALAHAHQRGVIHRDIKPSNLILDPSGTVWLTDFGLAKRSEEVTLTAAGVMMGTPRYMSPEQANATTHPIDHRTDIYSLGATLYELATGKPVFDAASPQAVITQILNNEPLAPRSLDGTLPKDLETIILKCLSKEPRHRYAQARELADDLRAFQENRPIRARRTTIVEKATRWVRKNQKTAFASGITAAASVLVLCGTVLGWNAYKEAQTGQLALSTDGPSLVAEVSNDKGESVLPKFPIPTSQPVKLPEGEYQVRLTAPGLLSEDWRIGVPKGQLKDISLRLTDRTLGQPFDLRGSEPPQFIELNGQNHILQKGDRGWRLIHGKTFNPVWSSELGVSPSHYPFDQFTWNCPNGKLIDILQAGNNGGWANSTGEGPGLANKAIDIDGDGVDDLILGSRVSSTLMAVSGKTGKGLWFNWISPGLPESHDWEKDPILFEKSQQDAGILGTPLVTYLNGEPVVVAVSVSFSARIRTKSGKEIPTTRSFFVDVISAKSGKKLWQRAIDLPELTNEFSSNLSKLFLNPPQILFHGKRSTLVLGIGSRIIGIDMEKGTPAWSPIALKSKLVEAPVFGDFDGDGFLDALTVSQKVQFSDDWILRAFSLADEKPLWDYSFRSPLYDTNTPGAKWIHTADPDGDGKPEILIPVKDNWREWNDHWYGVESIDPASGRILWQKKLKRLGRFSGSGMGCSIRIIHGPDLDGDSRDDYFIASISNFRQGIQGQEGPTIQVDAISSNNGESLWRTFHPIGENYQLFDPPVPLKWWQPGKDGWPQLTLPISKGQGGQPLTLFLSSGNGKTTHILAEVGEPSIKDLDSDGIPDIHYTARSSGNNRFVALKGLPPTEWRRPESWRLGGDFDGDGTVDFLETGSKLTARSGVDGKPIWQAPGILYSRKILVCKCNADDTPDVIFLEQIFTSSGNQGAITAVSGKDGSLIWRNEDINFTGGSSSSSGAGPIRDYEYPLLKLADLDPVQGTTLIFANPGQDGSLNLQAFSCKDGNRLWKLPAMNGAVVGTNPMDRNLYHDLDGDGCKDLVVWASANPNDPRRTTDMVLKAISGKNGRELWTAGKASLNQSLFLWPRSAIADLDGDGIPEVVITTTDGKGYNPDKKGFVCELVVLDGRDGTRRWNWPWISSSINFWPPLLVDCRGDGKRVICMGTQGSLPNGSETVRVIVFDPLGKIVMAIESTPDKNDPLSLGMLVFPGPDGVNIPANPTQWLGLGNRIWGVATHKVDGKETLIYRATSGLVGFGLFEKKPLWFCPTQSWRSSLATSLIDPVTKNELWNLWVESALYELDPNQGTAKWRTDICRSGSNPVETAIWNGPASSNPPLILIPGENTVPTILQHSWPVDQKGNYLTNRLSKVKYGASMDRDKLRRLPWLWSLGPVPLSIQDTSLDFPKANGSTEALLQLGGFSLFVFSFFWISMKGMWRRILVYLFIWICFSLLAAWVLLYFDQKLMDPEERYYWNGWFWILYQTGYLLGWLLMVGYPVIWSGQFFQKRFFPLTKRA